MKVKARFVGKSTTYFPDSDFKAEPNKLYEADIEMLGNGVYRFNVADIVRNYPTVEQLERHWVLDWEIPVSF